MPVVVITGASAGVGRALARRFGREGAKVALIARGVERLEATATELRHMGAEPLVLPLDVSEFDDVDRAASEVEASLGPIDVWINCAMVTVFAPFSEITAAEFQRVTATTFLGCVHGTMAALKHMRKRNTGTVVQVGSALAYRSIPLQAPYCAAKHAIVGFTDSLRSELIHDGSRINLTTVHLPAVNTPQFDWARNKLRNRAQPLPPIYEPEQVAHRIYEAALDPAREHWIGWPTVKAILGQRIVPWFADAVLATKAYKGQLDRGPALTRSDNLMHAIDGSFAARGRFANRTNPKVPLSWDTRKSKSLLLLASGLAIGVAISLGARLVVHEGHRE